MDTASCKLLYS